MSSVYVMETSGPSRGRACQVARSSSGGSGMGDARGGAGGGGALPTAPGEARGVLQLLLMALLRADWPSPMLGSARLLPPLGPRLHNPRQVASY